MQTLPCRVLVAPGVHLSPHLASGGDTETQKSLYCANVGQIGDSLHTPALLILMLATVSASPACGSLPPTTPQNDSPQSADVQTEPMGDSSGPRAGPDSTAQRQSDAGDSLRNLDSAGTIDVAGAGGGAERICFPQGSYRIDMDIGHWELDISKAKWQVVELDAFCMDVIEVTRGEWRKCVDSGKCTTTCVVSCSLTGGSGSGCSKCLSRQQPCPIEKRVVCNASADAASAHTKDDNSLPMRFISPGEAEAFCTTMRNGGRLPTLSQWRVAMSASKPCNSDVSGGGACISTLKKFPWGNQWPPPFGHANVAPMLGVDSSFSLSPAAGRKPNDAGIYDMVGNVSELLRDHAEECRGCRSTTISSLAVGGTYAAASPKDMRASIYDQSPNHMGAVGFRCVSDP